MNLIFQRFQSNLDIVFFIYGLSFFAMGIAILIQPKKRSKFKLGGILWLFVSYALLHATADFMDAWAVLKGESGISYQFKEILKFISYLFLFEFGRRLIGLSKKIVQWWFLPVITIGIVIASALSNNFWRTANILVGNFLRFPAGIMAGLGLFLYYRLEKKDLKPLKVQRYFYWTGSALLAWSFFCGLIRARADFLLAHWLNTETFFQVVRIPVYPFRTICALIVTWGLLGMLRIFNWEQQLQDALQIREQITEGIEEGILLIDRNFKVIWANKKQREVFGERIVGDYCYHATHHADKPCQPPNDICPVSEVTKSGKSATVAHIHFDKDGNELFTEISVYPIRDERGEITQFVHIARDITERRRWERQLEQQRNWFEVTLSSIGDAVIATDIEQRINFMNPIAEHLTGWVAQEAMGKNINEVFCILNEQTRKIVESPFQRLFSEGMSIRLPHNLFLVAKGGREVPINDSMALIRKKDGTAYGMVLVFRDITERRQMEMNLIQSAKMASVGQLSASVAHEINNPLTGVLNNVQLIKMELEQGREGSVSAAQFKEAIESIEESALRCKKITKSLLDFSHTHKLMIQPVSINEMIEKVITFVEYELKLQNISIQTELTPQLPPVLGNAQLLQQVMMNFISNAQWAIKKKSGREGGAITIKTEYDAQNRKIHIYISDTGIGMSDETLKKIFEPFFTTKEVGEGTGLGLSVVYGIIKEHEGKIEIQSQLNKGATFKITLPALLEKKNA